jgi:hypothetical protein
MTDQEEFLTFVAPKVLQGMIDLSYEGWKAAKTQADRAAAMQIFNELKAEKDRRAALPSKSKKRGKESFEGTKQ